MRIRIYPIILAGLLWSCDSGSTSVSARGDGSLSNAFGGSSVGLNDIVWKFRAESEGPTTVMATAKHAYVTGADGKLRAFVAGSGDAVWEAELGASSFGEITVTPRRILVGTNDGVVAVGLDGAKQWTHRAEAPVDGAVLVHESVAYFGSRDGSIWAVDAIGGTLIWRAKTAGPLASGCALAGDAVLCGGGDGYLWKLDAATGEALWSWSPSAPVRGVAVAGGRVVVTAGTRVVSLGLDEPKEHWQFDLGRPVETPPTIVGGAVIAATGEGDVVSLDADDGSQAWRVTVGAPVRGAITASGGIRVAKSISPTARPSWRPTTRPPSTTWARSTT